MEERIYIQNDLAGKQALDEFMALPDGPRKHIEFEDRFKNSAYFYSEIYRKDGNLYYAQNNVRIKRSKNSYYTKRVTQEGFTLDSKGKLKVWFGKDARRLASIHLVFAALKIDWVKQLPDTYSQFITKTVLEKMLNGKITNPIDFCKQVLRNIGQSKSSPKLMYRAMMTNLSNNDSWIQRPPYMSFINAAKTAKDFNHYLEALISYRIESCNHVLEDMQRQAEILERKIDYNWSANRISEEHTKWTREIMDLKATNLSGDFIPALEWFDDHIHLVHKSMTLVKTEQEMYFEGSFMNHCVFTNYTNLVKQGSYIVYHVNYNGEQATAGIRIFEDVRAGSVVFKSLIVDQVRSFRNKDVSPELQSVVKESVMALDKAYKEMSSVKPKDYIRLYSTEPQLQVVNF